MHIFFNWSKIYWMSSNSKIKMYMHRNTRKVHWSLVKKRPGSTSATPSVPFISHKNKEQSYTGSHHFARSKRVHMWRNSSPRGHELHSSTEVTESVSQMSWTRSGATGVMFVDCTRIEHLQCLERIRWVKSFLMRPKSQETPDFRGSSGMLSIVSDDPVGLNDTSGNSIFTHLVRYQHLLLIIIPDLQV